MPLIERAHPDLGRLGVFWHTQGSGKSYSMVFFAEKVRRVVPGNFTFVVMTDREDLDDQIWRTFVGCGVVDEKTPAGGVGRRVQGASRAEPSLRVQLDPQVQSSRGPQEPYSRRDDIIVISDEAHRTQAGKFARNMRLALPNASFIGFTGTPILQARPFDQAHLRQVHLAVRLQTVGGRPIHRETGLRESRREAGHCPLDLNDRIAAKIEEAELDPDQVAHLEKLLGQDYEVMTADDRLDKFAVDFVEHCSTRWECGKSMLVCIDKITCARMLQRIEPVWEAKLAQVKALIPQVEAELAATSDEDEQERLAKLLENFAGRPSGWKAVSSRSSSARHRTRSRTSPNGTSTSSRIAS